MKRHWKLNEYEHKLVSKVFREKGTIFVEPDGTLREIDGVNFDLINSKWFDNLTVFIQAVETAKLIVYIRSLRMDELK